MRIKICGITSPGDRDAAIAAGADALGFVLCARSPRHVALAQLVELLDGMPPFVQSVGLFLDPAAEWVRQVVAAAPIDLLQFHGGEAAAFCRDFGRPYIKSVPMGTVTDPSAYMNDYPDARGFLFDSNALSESGGSGERFDWARCPSLMTRPAVLAGGLNAANLAEAIGAVRPFAVNVSSGVERSPGVKHAAKMQAFCRAARGVIG